MTLSRPRMSASATPRQSSILEPDQLLVLAVAMLLLQNDASWMLVLALLYIAM